MNRPIAKVYAIIRMPDDVQTMPREHIPMVVRVVKVFRERATAAEEAQRLNALNGPKGEFYYVSKANMPDLPLDPLGHQTP